MLVVGKEGHAWCYCAGDDEEEFDEMGTDAWVEWGSCLCYAQVSEGSFSIGPALVRKGCTGEGCSCVNGFPLFVDSPQAGFWWLFGKHVDWTFVTLIRDEPEQVQSSRPTPNETSNSQYG